VDPRRDHLAGLLKILNFPQWLSATNPKSSPASDPLTIRSIHREDLLTNLDCCRGFKSLLATATFRYVGCFLVGIIIKLHSF
jgi:hypothetical protein